MPRFSANAAVTIYWLQAPLFSAFIHRIGPITNWARMYHTATAFEVVDQGVAQNYTMEFDATEGVAQFAPYISPDGQFHFKNGARYCLTEGLKFNGGGSERWRSRATACGRLYSGTGPAALSAYVSLDCPICRRHSCVRSFG